MFDPWLSICGWNVVAAVLICAPEIVRFPKFFGELTVK